MTKAGKYVGIALLIIFLVLLFFGGYVALNTSGDETNPAPSIFGVNISPRITNRVYEKGTIAEIAVLANAYWTRTHIYWWWVEPEEGGDYQWFVDVDADGNPETSLDEEMAGLAGSGMNAVVILHGTPGWADGNESPDPSCRPVAPNFIDDFGRFAEAVVERYDGDGLNDAPGSPRITHWEIWNEPDVPAGIANRNEGPGIVVQNGGVDGYGCWRNDNNPEKSGERYRVLMEEAYAAVKSADPTAVVVLGGLALDCASDFDPGGSTFEEDCTTANFIDGVLGPKGDPLPFDVAAFHAYAFWGDVKVDWDVYYNDGAHFDDGGLMLAKYNFLRNKFAEHGLPQIPILLSETGLLCIESYDQCLRYDEDPNDETPGRNSSEPDFYEAHANFVVRQFVRAWANGIEGVMWYSMYGEQWRDSDLLAGGAVPKLGYETFFFLGNELENAEFFENLSTEQFEGYRFCKGLFDYRIYWTNDDTSAPIPEQPGLYSVTYDKLGRQTGTDNITFEPIIIKNFALKKCDSQ